MADCPYARCIQERKHIRRELLRWTKNMVFVVGLERVAEELMGRRRWKQYQDTLYTTRSTSSTNENNNATSTPTNQQQQLQLQLQQLAQQVQQQQQQAKPGEPPLKAALSNHLQHTNASALTNCGSSGPVGAVGGERSPQRADEQNLTTTGGPENGERLVAAAAATCGVTRENGSSENGPANDEHHHRDHQEDHHRQPGSPAANNEEDEPEALRLKKELLEERIRLGSSPNHHLDEPLAPTNNQTNDSEGTKQVVKEEAGLDRIQAPTTQGLLRVKKEEDLQDPGGGGLNCPRPTSTPILAHNNNNSISNNNNGPTEISRSASTPPKKEGIFCVPSYVLGRRPSPPPEDWKPLDKCYFCLDGKLPNDDHTHEEQPPLSPQSDNSSNSSRSAESPMSVQVDPMASVVAAALGGGFPTLLPQWLHPQRDQSHVAAVVAAAAAAAAAQHQENAGADQPLDLSAKPKNSQDNNISLLEQKIPLRMSASIDPKTIYNSTCYRAKPRVTGAVTGSGVPVVGGGGGGRRTYTEDELQAALRDIQSGKLGTRRAAVLYGIPRSTLRNKVYKLAMERERDATLSANAAAAAAAAAAANITTNNTTAHNSELAGAGVVATNANANTATSNISTTTITTTPNTTIRKNAAAASLASAHTLLVDEVDDKELSGAEEEKEVEKALQKPLVTLEDLVRISNLEGSSAAGDSLRALLQRGQEPGSTEWSAFEHHNIGPYIQKMIAAATPYKGRIGFGGMDTQDYRIPEVMRRLMSEDKKLSKDINVNGDQVQQIHHLLTQQHRFPQSNQRTPMTNEDFNPALEEEASDSGQGRPILKIPSYKPASSGTGTPGPSKNGAVEPSGFGGQGPFSANASPALLERASPAFSGTSSPTNSLVGKGMAVNFRDVIAKSISVKFQEGQPTSGIPGQGVQTSPMIVESNPYKRGRFTPPQQQSQQSGQNQQTKSAAQAQDKQQQNKAAAGGKGTRPKRGKYRNYDRDSLVEAVRAVQRGEMSVHRAGSYYGVPHSTLEYKVKERHLMRPRKRDQKQADDKTKETAVVGSALRTPPTPGAATTPEKKAAPMLKPQKPFSPAGGAAAAGNAAAAATAAGAGIPGPNGIKVSPFIDGMPHLPFGHPFNFWNPTFMPPGFIPGAPANVPTAALLSEQYFATQRMRGLHQEQRRNAIAQQERDGTTTTEQPGTSNPRATPLIKSENLYADGAASNNGSFLDNLIRSSLESGVPAAARSNAAAQQQPENLGNSKVLIDQLCRNSRRTPLPRAMQQDSSEDEANTPTNYSTNSAAGGPQRPERVPTVELSPSPRAAVSAGADDACSDRASPLSLSRHSGSGKEDDATSRSSREREVPNGGGSEKLDDRLDSTTTKKLNHYPDTQNLYAVSTDKKSACDSKLIVDHSSQKAQQHKVTTVIGATSGGDDAHQLQQRGYANSASDNGRSTTPNDLSPSPQPTTMEESVEQ